MIWLVLAVLAGLTAAVCAYADGALLAIDDDESVVALTPDVRALLGRRERAHRALAFARILSQLMAGAATAAAIRVTTVSAERIAPFVLVAGILLVVVTESAARTAGDAAGAAAVQRLIPTIRLIERVLRPIVEFGAWSDAALHRAIPARALDDDAREATLEQFREVVSTQADATTAGETLLHGVFALGHTDVQAIMIPRVDIVGLEQNTPWSQVADKVRSAQHSRLVVYDGTLDEVVGILYAKDLLPALVAGTEPEVSWASLVKPASFIPATKPVDDQLRDFKASQRHMAIVVDEYGGTAGLVTLEDALELIVGEIHDENDDDEPDVVRESDDRFRISAGISLDELSELTGHDFTREDVQTVGGLLHELFGHIPRNGERLVVGKFRFTTERVVKRRIERVHVERLATPK